MAERQDLADWLRAALKSLGGEATIPAACEEIWRQHEAELQKSGDLLWTWQYEVRWAAHRLRTRGVLKAADLSPRGTWQLT